MTRNCIALSLAATAALLSAGLANAADMSFRAPPAAAPLPYSWTGFYLGANVGYANQDNETRVAIGGVAALPSFDTGAHGVLGGLQAGYNWEFGGWVLGVETDIQATGIKSTTNCVLSCNTATGTLALTQELPWFGTLRGRIGTAMGNFLLYYTGGLAYGNVETNITETLAGASGAFSFKQTRTGWTVGSGVEAALGGGWVGRAEYLFVDLGTVRESYTLAGTSNLLTSDVQTHIFRVGANYRFGATGAPAPMAVPRWEGLHIGATVGGAVGRDSVTHLAGAAGNETYDVTPKGYFGGAIIGYNWQAANWVYGVEADLQGSTQESTQTCGLTCSGAGATFLKQEMPWFGTARARLGYSFGPALFYATGGFAFGSIKNTITESGPAPTAVFDFDQTKSGYAVGGGVETPVPPIFGWSFPNLTTRTEYLYIDLGTVTDNYTYAATARTLTTDVRNHVFRSVVSYKFGGL